MPKPLPPNIETGPGQGAGRPGPPGPPGAGFSAGLDLAGTSSEQAVIGFRARPLSTDVPADGDAYVFDAGTGTWVPEPAGGGGGTVPALSSYLFVDGGTTTSGPDGSIGKPFPTVQQALDVVAATPGTWGVFISPGEYSESLSLSGTENQVSLYSPAYGLVFLNSNLSWEISSQCSVTLRNITINQVTASDGANIFPNSGVLYLDNSSTTEAFSSTYEMDIVVSGPDSFVESVDITGMFSASGSKYVKEVQASSVQVESSFIRELIDSSSGNMILTSCQFENSTDINMSGYMQSLYMDATTYYWFLETNVTLVGTGVKLSITDTGTTTQSHFYNADSFGYTYTAAQSDAGRCVSISAAGSPITVVIPSGMPAGCTILFYQANTQRLTLTGGLGVSVFASVAGSTWLTTFAPGSVLTAYQITPNEWVVTGDSLGLHSSGGCAKSGTTTTGTFACAENLNTTAIGDNSHAEGNNTQARGNNSHSEGQNGVAGGLNAHVEGIAGTAAGDNSHVEGNTCTVSSAGTNAHAEGNNTTCSGVNSHAEGRQTSATQDSAHAEGVASGATAAGAHAEGFLCSASGTGSHAEGVSTSADGDGSHSEGQNGVAQGVGSHVEGGSCVAVSRYSHASGFNSKAYQECDYAHAGSANQVAGDCQYRRQVVNGGTDGSLPGQSTTLKVGVLASPIALQSSTCYGVTMRAVATRGGLGASARQAVYFFKTFLVAVDSSGNVTISAVTDVVAPTIMGAGFVGATLVPSTTGANNLTITFTIGAGLSVQSLIVANIEYSEIGAN